MLKGNDKQLYDYTTKMMENITTHYLKTDFNKGTDVKKLIERGVARKIAAIMPDKYTEVEVTVEEVGKNLCVAVIYYIEGVAEIVAACKEEVYTNPDITTYDPYSLSEDFFFGHPRPTTKEGRGSKVESLPCPQGLGEVEKNMSYYQRKCIKGLGLQAPTLCAPLTEKPFVDFSQISQLNPPNGQEFTRYESGMHVGIDLAKVNVEDQQQINVAIKEMSTKIDKQISEDIMDAAKAVDMSESIWAVPTFGWTEEKTNWDKPEDLKWNLRYDNPTPIRNHFGGVLTTDIVAPVWCDPSPTKMEEISFTEEELDELIDLIHNCKSEVMKFA